MAMTKLNKIIQQWSAKKATTALVCCQSWLRRRGDLALGLLQLVGKGKLGSLLLQLGELVLVLGDLLQGGLDELALHVTDGDGELVDLEVAEDDLTLQEEHLALEAVPLVEVLLADLLQVVHGGGVKVGLGATPLGDHPQPLLCLPLLLLLQLLRGLLPEQGPQLLLPLGGHESLLLGHGDGFLLPVLDGDESLQQQKQVSALINEIWLTGCKESENVERLVYGTGENVDDRELRQSKGPSCSTISHVMGGRLDGDEGRWHTAMYPSTYHVVGELDTYDYNETIIWWDVISCQWYDN